MEKIPERVCLACGATVTFNSNCVGCLCITMPWKIATDLSIPSKIQLETWEDDGGPCAVRGEQDD